MRIGFSNCDQKGSLISPFRFFILDLPTMRQLVLTVAPLLCFLILPNTSLAECACPPKPEPRAAFDASNFCFVGRAENVQESPLRKGEMEIKFSVLKRFKTPEEPLGSQVIIFTNKDAGDCGYNFVTGQDYLVYSEGTVAHLKTTSCMRTEYLDNALEEVEKLISWAPATATPAASANP